MGISWDGESALSRETPRLSTGSRTTATTSYDTALHALLDASDQPVFALDRELCYTAFNRAHAVVMGALYGADITLGGRLPDYRTIAADRETSTANLERVLEVELDRADGSRIWVRTIGRPLVEDGQVVL
jgi:PAS domain-containing protein